MKTPNTYSLAFSLIVALGVGQSFFLPSASGDSVVVYPESELFLDGDSTVKKFTSKTTGITLQIKKEASPKAASQGGSLEDRFKAIIPELVMEIPVRSLKSDSGTLDEHLKSALKAETFPTIKGSIRSYKVTQENHGGPLYVTASVDLTIAGTMKTVPVDAVLSEDGEKIRVKGEKRLLMTDFGVTPPTLMLGVLKTDNEIKIRFDLLLGIR
jgi:hypothetical protein